MIGTGKSTGAQIKGLSGAVESLDYVLDYLHAKYKNITPVKEMLPNLPQVFVFDTAFHQTMPAKAYMYAVPYKYYEQNNIRRWGAHGTSHRFVTARGYIL